MTTPRDQLEDRLGTDLLARLEGRRAVLLAGWPGCGKSWVAENLAAAFGWERLSSDAIRLQRPGQSHRGAADEEELQRIREEVYVELGHQVSAALQSGRSTIVDATHTDARREHILDAVLSQVTPDQAAFLVLDSPRDVIAKRVQRDGPEALAAWSKLYDELTGAEGYSLPSPESSRGVEVFVSR